MGTFVKEKNIKVLEKQSKNYYLYIFKMIQAVLF